MKNYLKFLIFTLCLSGGFFGVGIYNKAQAACSYTVSFSERDGKTAVTPADYLSFSIQVVRSGSDQECAQNANISLWLNTKSEDKLIGQTTKNFSTVQGLGSTASANLGLDVKTIDRSILPETNILEFYVSVLVADLGPYRNVASSVSHIKIPVTGVVGSSGSVKMNVYFKDGQTAVQKSSFKAGDQVQILIQANNSDVNNLSSDIQNIYAAIYVNNFSKEVASVSASKSAWSSQTQFKTISVSKENGFVDGTNTIRVKLFQANTSVSLGYADSTMQVQGTGVSAGTGSDNSTGGGGTDTGTGGSAAGGGMQSQNASTLYNPIKNADNLLDLLLKIMQGFLMVIAVWAVVFVVIGGFKLVISQGNEEAVTAAKKTITWAVLGVVIAMLAFSLIAIVQNLIGIDVKDVKTSQHNTLNQTQKL